MPRTESKQEHCLSSINWLKIKVVGGAAATRRHWMGEWVMIQQIPETTAVQQQANMLQPSSLSPKTRQLENLREFCYRVNYPVEWMHYGDFAKGAFCRRSLRLSQYATDSKSITITLQRSHNRLELFGFTLVFYGRLHKHEYFSCHKTFPPLEQRVGKKTRQRKVHRLYNPTT